MRKLVILAALLVAFESIAVPLSGVAEATICGEGGCPVPPKKSPPPAQHQIRSRLRQHNIKAQTIPVHGLLAVVSPLLGP